MVNSELGIRNSEFPPAPAPAPEHDGWVGGIPNSEFRIPNF